MKEATNFGTFCSMRAWYLCLPILFCVSAHATVLRVPDEYSTVQHAVIAAMDRDTVLVSAGWYSENIRWGRKSLVLASAFLFDPTDTTAITETVISSMDTTDLHRPVTIDSIPGGIAKIIGLTLRDGNTGQPAPPYTREYHGGALLSFADQTVVSDCYFIENIGGRSGAISIRKGDVTIRNSRFISNRYHFSGVILLSNEQHNTNTASIESNYFYDNVYAENLSPLANTDCSCIRVSNRGGTISGTIRGNRFVENRAHSVGVIDFGANPVRYGIKNWIIEGNSFINNHSSEANAVLAIYCDTISFQNNRVIDNQTSVNPHYPNVPPSSSAVTIGNDVAFAEISGNYFHNNTSHGAGVLFCQSAAAVHHNIFDFNRGHQVGLLYSFTNPGVPVDPTSFYSNIVLNNTPYDSNPHYLGLVSPLHGTTLQVYQNDFIDNQDIVIGWFEGVPQGGTIEIGTNFYGHPSGPYHATLNPGGQGDTLMDHPNVHFDDFSTAPMTAPDSFALLLPIDGRALEHSIEFFEWETAEDHTTLTPVTYTLQISNDAEFDPVPGVTVSLDVDTVTHSWVYAFPDGDILYWRVLAKDSFELVRASEVRTLHSTLVITDQRSDLPTSWDLRPVYPNPFNARAQVRVAAPMRAYVEANVYDIQGRLVQQIYAGEVSPGYLGLTIAPRGASGVYVLRVRNDRGWSEARKVVMLR
ncbi:T9SS type A sorting domain-containing protein [bacterium]|nr:T9SS type A sorting domain-containing protein [bacterium]